MAEQLLQDPDRLRSIRRRAAPLTASEPPSVFAIKSLLYPVVAVGCLLACLLFWRQPLPGPYFLVAVLAFIGSAHFLDVARLKRPPGRALTALPLLDILLRWMFVVAFIWALLYLSRLTAIFDMHLLGTWALLTPACLWIAETAAHVAVVRAGSREELQRKAIIIGLTEPGLLLEQELANDPSLRIQVQGFFDDRRPDRLPARGADRVLGSSKELPRFVRNNNISVAYVTLPMTSHARLQEIVDALRDETVSVYFVPNMLAFDLVQARLDVLGGIPVMAVCESPFYGASSIAKRMMDLVLGGMALLLLAPIMLAVALGVRLSSPGPVTFRQRRYGLDGREIIVYKFRSMTVTEDGDKQYRQVTVGDARVTPFGRFIRRFSLDELPQLFNVLEGTLSMVGPRPHAIAVNEQYRRLIPGYMFRHKIKPGITGWAQVNGYRGGDDLESMRKRVEFDMDYLRHWSLALDLWILWRTASIVWRDHKAF